MSQSVTTLGMYFKWLHCLSVQVWTKLFDEQTKFVLSLVAGKAEQTIDVLLCIYTNKSAIFLAREILKQKSRKILDLKKMQSKKRF